jgi:hypothetical protein
LQPRRTTSAEIGVPLQRGINQGRVWRGKLSERRQGNSHQQWDGGKVDNPSF